MILQMQILEKGSVGPRRFIFERREIDAYRVEESTLVVTSLVRDEAQSVSAASVLEQEAAEQIEYVPSFEAEIRPVPQPLTEVQFRQAVIEVDDPDEFWAGVVGGQVAATEEAWPLTGAHVFKLFEDATGDLEFSETWLAGYLLGLSDALLRHRKIYPRSYAAQLKPFKYHSHK